MPLERDLYARIVNAGHRPEVVLEIVEEAKRGNQKHGPFNYPDGTWNGGMRLHQRAMAQLACDRAERGNGLTAAKVLEEEVCEALAEEDKLKLRAELVQVAAVAMKWVEKLDAELTG